MTLVHIAYIEMADGSTTVTVHTTRDAAERDMVTFCQDEWDDEDGPIPADDKIEAAFREICEAGTDHRWWIAEAELDRRRAARAGDETTGARRRITEAEAREQLLTLIRESPAGLSRVELLERMGLAGNAVGNMLGSNALTALTKNKQIERIGDKYNRRGGE